MKIEMEQKLKEEKVKKESQESDETQPIDAEKF